LGDNSKWFASRVLTLPRELPWHKAASRRQRDQAQIEAVSAQGDFTTMPNAFIMAAALALGALACTSPAQALSPLTQGEVPSLLIPVEDIENQEVGHDLDPNLVPLPSQEGTEPEKSMRGEVERPKGDAKYGDPVEEKEFKQDGIGQQ
jgi:hypothetical protein